MEKMHEMTADSVGGVASVAAVLAGGVVHGRKIPLRTDEARLPSGPT